MSQVQKIRRRIKSVKNIKQITGAMEMVAASKLRRAQAATFAARTYATAAREVLARLTSAASTVLLENNQFFRQPKEGKRLLVVFTSDRGLSGSYNGNVLKMLVRILTSSQSTSIIMVGQKGAQFLQRLSGSFEMVGVYTNWPYCPTLADIAPIAKTAQDLFVKGEVAQVSVLYTNYISVSRHEVVLQDLLPIEPMRNEHTFSDDSFLFEPSPQEVLDYVVPRLTAVQLYQASLEAAASEQAARMMAMQNATDSAGDILEDLTLEHNTARQAVITAELAEISGGVAAVV